MPRLSIPLRVLRYDAPMRSRILSGLVMAGLLVTLAAPDTLAAGGDTDGDGLWDRFEERWGVTDPKKRDTDRDGVKDALEDEDGDRLSNLGEQRFQTDPTRADTDGDGQPDGLEDHNDNGLPNAVDQDMRPVPRGLVPHPSEAFWDVPESYSDGCHTSADSAVIRPCPYGRASADTSVAIFGDSHALQWLPALDKAGRQEGWEVMALTKSACPSVDVAFSGAAYDEFAQPCRQATGAFFASLTEIVCRYDPCPVVSESTLMWRNESHLTATFAQQLWPALRDIVADALAAGPDDERSEL